MPGISTDAPSISFEGADIAFALPYPTDTLQAWIKKTVLDYGHSIHALTFIFCSDEFLLKLNETYLQHYDYTDVITFPYHESGDPISGDVFISWPRVKENAQQLGIAHELELLRVIIHGVLHLLGFEDTSPAQKSAMREREDRALAQFQAERST